MDVTRNTDPATSQTKVVIAQRDSLHRPGRLKVAINQVLKGANLVEVGVDGEKVYFVVADIDEAIQRLCEAEFGELRALGKLIPKTG